MKVTVLWNFGPQLIDLLHNNNIRFHLSAELVVTAQCTVNAPNSVWLQRPDIHLRIVGLTLHIIGNYLVNNL